ncbi:MAG: hypothetical protein EA393_14890 [Bacteroidetes bacterium]|nr:MAG: hypothetical protein EA393_14890 [Bacteroidota bacterium]
MTAYTFKPVNWYWRKHSKKLLYPALIVLGLLIYFAMTILFEKEDPTAVAEQKAIEEKANKNQQYLEKAISLVHSNPDSSKIISQERIRALQGSGRKREMIPFYNLLGVLYTYQSEYNQAIQNLHRALELSYEEKELIYTAHAYQNIGLVNYFINKYRDAVDYFLMAIDLYEQTNNRASLLTAKNNLGAVYLEIDDLEKANAYFQEAYKGFEEMNHERISSVANHKAKLFLKMNKPDSAFFYFKKSIEIAREFDNNYGLTIVYYDMGNYFVETGDFPTAILNYQKSDSLAQRFGFTLQNCYALLGLSNTFLAQGNTEHALYYANLASEFAEKLQNEKVFYRVNETFSRIFEQLGNIEEAFRYLNYAKKNKSIFTDQAEISQVYNVEIDLLTRQVELKELEMERKELLLSKRKNTMYLILVTSLSLLIILSLLYYFYINKVKQAQREKLHQNKIRHSFEKNRAVMEAEINERKRLGSDLHDGIGTLLSLTKLNMTNILDKYDLQKEKRNTLLVNSVNNIDEVINEVKNISNNMTPIALSEKGFNEAIKELVGKITQFKVNLSINGLNGPLKPYLEHALYRTIQEALNNIAKHAQCSEVNIQVIRTRDEINIMIEDDGQGFNMNALDNHKGMGLKNASSRIESLNGEFLIDSIPGKGTFITVIMPLPNN